MTEVALTGATGAVGGAVLGLLERRGHGTVAVGRQGEVRWDLREQLPAPALAAFAGADVVVHAAADTRLGEPYADLRRVNVGAVAELVRSLGGLSRPPRLLYVSSAFAEPRTQDGYNNGYERSKHEAEAIVLGSRLDATVLRPSLVIGSRADGAIGRFSGIYSFVRMLRLGVVPAIPGVDEVGVDVIPVDVVAETAVAEAERPSGSRMVEITSGRAAPSLEQLVSVACDAFDARGGSPADRPKFVAPEVYHRLFRPLIQSELSPAQKVLLETIEVFLPYFERDHVFESGFRFTTAELLETWAKSVNRWLDETGHLEPRGRAVWAKRARRPAQV